MLFTQMEKPFGSRNGTPGLRWLGVVEDGMMSVEEGGGGGRTGRCSEKSSMFLHLPQLRRVAIQLQLVYKGPSP